MRIKEINVECKFLRALPNYQNVTFTAGCGAEISESDNVKECYKKLWDICGDQINEQLKLFEDKKNKS